MHASYNEHIIILHIFIKIEFDSIVLPVGQLG